MKKFLLSVAVIGLFFFYSLHQRSEESEVQVIAPKTLQITPTSEVTTPSVSSGSPPSGSQNNSQMGPMMNGGSGMMMGQYKDGTYTGSTEDVFYGNIQVQAVVSSGKITDVIFLQHPSDRQTSVIINSQAMPFLKQEAITAQNANVDIVSGATDSSQGFRLSLANALAQAQR